MSKAPKKIWVDVLEREIATWEFEESTPYIRADIVDAFVNSVKKLVDADFGHEKWDDSLDLIAFEIRDAIKMFEAKNK